MKIGIKSEIILTIFIVSFTFTLNTTSYAWVASTPRSEDSNGNGMLDPGEDINGNGMLDMVGGAGFSHGHWPGAIPWRYNPAGRAATVPGGNAGAIAAIQAAADTWENDPGSSVDFMRGPDTVALCTDRDGISTVGWAPLTGGKYGVTFLTPGPVVGGVATIMEADLCLDNRPVAMGGTDWTMIDLQSGALHEFGHYINLDHPDLSAVPIQAGTANGQRPFREYTKVVMYFGLANNVPKRRLLCDDKSGANFLYPPPGVTIETRDYRVQNSGGCDFGDAPDPFDLFAVPDPVGRYPSLENGEDFNNNGMLNADIDNPPTVPPAANFPRQFDNDFDWDGDGIFNSEDFVDGVLQTGNGARHKDPRMEWLGFIGESEFVFRDNQLGKEVRIRFIPKNPRILDPGPVPGDPPGTGIRVVPGQTSPQVGIVASPAVATFEPESRNPTLGKDQDELDDGVVLSCPFRPGVTSYVGVLVNTNGLATGAGRYNGLDANQRLYLNAWEDWNADRDWKDWGAPIAGGLIAGPGPGPCAPPAGGNDEYILTWQGAIGSDNFFSPNFCGGVQLGANSRFLIFKVRAPSNAKLSMEIWERFRLDYGENVGQNLRDFTDPTLGAIPVQGGGKRAVMPLDRLSGIGYDQGEAKYGEVEDYRHTVCDIDMDGDVDRNDVNFIFAARNTSAAPGDPRDINCDRVIDVNDARRCVPLCTNPNCAP